MFEGPSPVSVTGRSAGGCGQNAQGVMLAGIPAVSGYRSRSAATSARYPATSAGHRTSLRITATISAASWSGSGCAGSGGRTGTASGSRTARTSAANPANASSQ
ncbi:hypothetical protein [Streptomyces sp. AM 2-1-1]|uniref:hypothetical protein n=1 Tax=Streptomyces sp. AM 2-1-1 TaxID=3028709 RepID=UPI0031BA399A